MLLPIPAWRGAAVGLIGVHAAPWYGPPAAQEDRAIAALKNAVRGHIGLARLPATSQRDARRLLELIGTPNFYDVLATIDTGRAADWHEMGRVQRHFAAAEHRFDPVTRDYSECMRITLHAAVLQHLVDPSLRGERSLFESFLELHVTAFHENGGWFDDMRIPWHGAFDVLKATRPTMALHAKDLIDGVDQRDPAAIRAAAWVKAARAAAASRTP